MRCAIKSLCVSTLFLTALSTAALAQGIAAGSGELSGNVGFSNLKGADNNHHVNFGGSFAYNLVPAAAIGFEYNYEPLGSIAQQGVTASAHLQTYGVLYRASFVPSARTVPYILLAAGGANLNAAAHAGNVTVSASQNGAYFGFGGGASIYAGNNWGIRPEFRYERQDYFATTVSNVSIPSAGQNYYAGSVALFYQFGGTRSMKK